MVAGLPVVSTCGVGMNWPARSRTGAAALVFTSVAVSVVTLPAAAEAVQLRSSKSVKRDKSPTGLSSQQQGVRDLGEGLARAVASLGYGEQMSLGEGLHVIRDDEHGATLVG